MGKTWPNREGVLVFFLLKIRSRIYLCSSLLMLIIGTIVSWQFRYVETESVYWRDRPLEEITEWQRQNGSLAPILGNEGALEFSPQKGQQAISVKTWPVSGGEKIKVRVRYRSPNPIETSANNNLLPVSITIVGIDRYHRLVLDRVDHIVFESAPKKLEGIRSRRNSQRESSKSKLWYYRHRRKRVTSNF